MTPHERFHFACDELGWGSAPNGLWFFALEEAYAWKPNEQARIERHYAHGKYFRTDEDKYDSPEDGKSAQRIEWAEAKIAVQLSASGLTARAYKDTQLWTNRSRVAHGNLFPLGRPKHRQAFPSCYLQLFGFGSTLDEMRRYEREVNARRFQRIREAREKLRPQAIVCMGKGRRRDFAEAFGIALPAGALKASVVAAPFEKGAVPMVFMPHPSWPALPDAMLNEVATQLKGWGVALP